MASSGSTAKVTPQAAAVPVSIPKMARPVGSSSLSGSYCEGASSSCPDVPPFQAPVVSSSVSSSSSSSSSLRW
ncbi:hypothetical protein EYF80_047887 [Liparis tanakae]|uniref:Uncharacterized protein n=1 Tax=Liparis tanakae TaxID=230148 RepID=A0A4Z2FM25_9TELE|nr:hypothetical protein EYF80_047887 [Liparis tanakae]